MPASQLHISPATPVGARLLPDGATFRAYAPNATAVHLALFDAATPTPASWTPTEDNRLLPDPHGYWAGFFPHAAEGMRYRFWTAGLADPPGYKRDPRARELELLGWPDVDCILRGPDSYPWHDAAFTPPPFHDLILYQLHIGVFFARRKDQDIRHRRVSKFFDALDRLEYLAQLGINAVQPLPVVEWQGTHSRGYNNTDFFSPEMDYALPPEELGPYLDRINTLLRRKGQSELLPRHVATQVDQLKAFVDLCHVHGIAVILDVVYNHAGGPFDDQSMRFFDRPWNREWWDPDLYFQGGDGWAGGRIFDYATPEVRAFLLDNARLFYDAYHVDGFRFDEVSVMVNHGGWSFCRDLTSTLRYHKPSAIQIAEYWNWDRASAVIPAGDAGLGFDAAVHDALRNAVRACLAQAAAGASSHVNMRLIQDALRRPVAFPAAWRAVVHVENHDLVDADRANPAETLPRIPALADGNDRRSWWARSRSRVATGLVLTAPGIPMLFMGQEFLEDKPWHNNPDEDRFFLYWDGLDAPGPMRDFLRFTSELCWLRRRQPALRGEGVNPYFCHDIDRLVACHRWVEGAGRDVIVIASLNEATLWDYRLPFPAGGFWHEVFNSDAYDSLPPGGGYNPMAAGNPWGVWSDGPPTLGLPHSGTLHIPANALIVLARDQGD
jgi:1,4-alpha-glucan branching enzyme